MLRALLDWEEMSARARGGRGVPAAGTRQIPQKTGALRLRQEPALPRAAPQPSRYRACVTPTRGADHRQTRSERKN